MEDSLVTDLRHTLLTIAAYTFHFVVFGLAIVGAGTLWLLFGPR